MQMVLGTEFGGMPEALANLYTITGAERYLATAQRFYHAQVLDPLADGEDALPGLQANVTTPKIVACVRMWEETGSQKYHDIAQNFWDIVTGHHVYVIGGVGDYEHFQTADTVAAQLSNFTCENCASYNMLKLTRLLHFHQLTRVDIRLLRAHAVPDGPAINLAVKAVPGWRHVRLDPATRTLAMPAGIRLDLGATAKAWAADRAAARIAAELGGGVLVGLGGDIAVTGQAPPGGWRIRVQDVTGRPEDVAEGPYTVVAITSGGLATSSTTARRWRRGGNMLHHILDPRTGLPPAPVWRTVSVTAATCADANTASTAGIIRGEHAPGWLAATGLPARLVDVSGRVETVAGWPAEAMAH